MSRMIELNGGIDIVRDRGSSGGDHRPLFHGKFSAHRPHIQIFIAQIRFLRGSEAREPRLHAEKLRSMCIHIQAPIRPSEYFRKCIPVAYLLILVGMSGMALLGGGVGTYTVHADDHHLDAISIEAAGTTAFVFNGYSQVPTLA